jgi:hypothetical protein
VFVLAGDVHVGGMHLIHSNRRGDGHHHRRNRLVYQLTSSPVSNTNPDQELLDRFLDQVGGDVDLARAEFLKDAPDRESDALLGVTRFVLDRRHDGHYAAEFLGVLRDRNLGGLRIERVRDRVYRFTATIEGGESLVSLFELDLDADRVQPRDLVGERLSATGTPTLLRVHDAGGGFGGSGDRIDGEVIVQLDTEPGRSFGMTLRPDGDEAAHRGMLDQLREAFGAARPVMVEYDRTGPRNGTIVRVASRAR